MKGEYSTKQRQIIMQTLRDKKENHYTADELYTMLTENGIKIGKATVYRNLSKLADEGKLQKYMLSGDESTYFQYDCECEGFHLKCLNCGALTHLHCGDFVEIEKHISAEHDFVIDNKRTILYGYCGKCRKNQ